MIVVHRFGFTGLKVHELENNFIGTFFLLTPWLFLCALCAAQTDFLQTVSEKSQKHNNGFVVFYLNISFPYRLVAHALFNNSDIMSISKSQNRRSRNNNLSHPAS